MKRNKNTVQHHSKRLNQLIQQRQQLAQQFLFDKSRLDTLDKHLHKHFLGLVELTSFKQTDLKSHLLNILRNDAPNLQQIQSYHALLQLYLTDKKLKKLLETLFTLKPPSSEHFDFTDQFKLAMLNKDSRFILFTQSQFKIPDSLIAEYRNKAINNGPLPCPYLAGHLFNQNGIQRDELLRAIQHSDANIVRAAFTKIIVDDAWPDAQKITLNFIKQHPDASLVAQILALAGDTESTAWIRICKWFCQQYPSFTEYVLSHFHNKVYLPLVLYFVCQKSTGQFAYRAWQTLTHCNLYFEEDFAPQKSLNVEHAKSQINELQSKKGDNVLMGRSYHKKDFAEIFSEVGGIVMDKADSSKRLLNHHALEMTFS